VKIYAAAAAAAAAAVEALRKKKRKHRMKLSLPPNFGGKRTSLGPSYLFPFVKFSFPVTHLMPYYAGTGPRSRPPNRLTLQITLLCTIKLNFWKFGYH